MSITEKIVAVRAALAGNTEIAQWYANEHHVTADSFTADNVAAYGLNGLGTVADSILDDAGREE